MIVRLINIDKLEGYGSLSKALGYDKGRRNLVYKHGYRLGDIKYGEIFKFDGDVICYAPQKGFRHLKYLVLKKGDYGSTLFGGHKFEKNRLFSDEVGYKFIGGYTTLSAIHRDLGGNVQHLRKKVRDNISKVDACRIKWLGYEVISVRLRISEKYSYDLSKHRKNGIIQK